MLSKLEQSHQNALNQEPKVSNINENANEQPQTELNKKKVYTYRKNFTDQRPTLDYMSNEKKRPTLDYDVDHTKTFTMPTDVRLLYMLANQMNLKFNKFKIFWGKCNFGIPN